MTAGLPPPPEIKNFDSTISIASDYADTKIQISPDDILAGIVQGASPNQRVGRTIRVVGLVLRLTCQAVADGANPPLSQPYTVDVLWDNQTSNATPAAPPDITEVYTGPQMDALPNVNFSERFQFFKRFNSPPARSEYVSIVNATLKCSKIVEYKASTAALSDLTKCNLLMYMVSPGNFQVEGTVRVLYVDA